jgi:hypothetical protein
VNAELAVLKCDDIPDLDRPGKVYEASAYRNSEHAGMIASLEADVLPPSRCKRGCSSLVLLSRAVLGSLAGVVEKESQRQAASDDAARALSCLRDGRA